MQNAPFSNFLWAPESESIDGKESEEEESESEEASEETPMKSAAIEATELALGASLCEALLLADGARRLTHQGSSY